MEESTKPQAEVKQPKRSNNISKKILVALIAILLITGGFYGIYKWQNDQLTAANNRVSDLEQQTNELNESLKTLQASYDELKESSDSDESSEEDSDNKAKLDVSLTDSARFNIAGAINTPDEGVAVRMKISNNSDKELYVITDSILIKDSGNRTYKPTTQVPTSDIPSGYNKLTNQTIQPGETVDGALFYTVENLSLKDFRLISGTDSINFTVQ